MLLLQLMQVLVFFFSFLRLYYNGWEPEAASHCSTVVDRMLYFMKMYVFGPYQITDTVHFSPFIIADIFVV